MITETGKNLIFLISQPRSGSTLLQRVLAGNSLVHTTAEPWLMLPLIYPLRDVGHTADYDAKLAHAALTDFCRGLPKDSYLKSVARAASYLYRQSLPPGKTIFLDKTPRYYHIIPELAWAFPDAKFVFLVRNPLAVLASIIETWSGTDPDELAGFRADLEVAPGLIANAVADNLGVLVDYDTFVTRPEFETKRLCGYLGLRYDELMLDYGSGVAPQGSMGDQVGIPKFNRPVTDSIHKWKVTLKGSAERTLAREYLSRLPGDSYAVLGHCKDYWMGQLNSL
jgi:hypothetical protein